jgi:uncharacterized protein YfdQ (DUF2303 family)
MADQTEASTVAQLGQLGVQPTDVGGKLAYPVARDLTGEVISLEKHLPRPSRIRERATLFSVQSLIDYANLHKNDASIILADQDNTSLTVVVDYHDGKANNRDHTGGLKLEYTTGLKAWISHHKKQMNQEQFGLFLEENAVDIVDPAAATMIQVATSLRAIKSTDFESKVRLDNGAFTFAYKEEIKGTYQDGTAEVPASFFLGVVPYRGMPEAYKIEAKLRYRVSQGGLTLWYAIPDLERLLEKAFEEVKSQVGEATGLKVFDGKL